MSATAGRSLGRVAGAGVAANLAVVALFALHVYQPHIRFDDFNFLTLSRTWGGAFAALWQPMNDHAMPMCRLAAAALMQVVPGQSAIPAAAQMQGPLAVIVGMWLLHLFVRRELGHAVYGLVAMTLWGVTTAYIQAVTWYSGSFFILSLDTLLLGLLAAQAWRRTRRWRYLVLCAAWCAVAPGWFGGGILAGPWCAVYLLPAWGEDRCARNLSTDPSPTAVRRFARLLPAAVPAAGSLLFLAVSLPRTAERIVHASHYEGKTVFEAFSLSAGIRDTVRTLADNQVLGAVGIYRSAAFGWPAVTLITGVLLALAVLWWRAAPNRRLLALGLAIILASDVLTYGARAEWGYVRTVHTWSRYHLFPHLGLVLFVVGGLPRFLGTRLLPAAASGISRRQMATVLALVVVAFACHLTRSVRSHVFFPEQIAVLKRVERVDNYCRTVGISGATAREALGFLAFPLGYAHDNAWDFLQGSPEPGSVSVQRARELLAR
jgi:hypothetical protein